MNRLTRSITLVLIGSPWLLLGCEPPPAPPEGAGAAGRTGPGSSSYVHHSGGGVLLPGRTGVYEAGGGPVSPDLSWRGGFGSMGQTAG